MLIRISTFFLFLFPLFLQSQNVGIGTSTPTDELHIHNTDNDDDVVLRLTTSIAELFFGFNPSNGGLIGTVSNHNLRFRTKNANRLVIDTLGQVGIGITNPTEKLELRNGNLLISGLGATNEKGLLFGESNTPLYGWIYDGIGSGSNNQLHLREYLGSPSDIMTIKGDGRIGMGTNDPTEKLEIHSGSLLLSNLGASNEKGFLLGEGNNPVYGWIYDGEGTGSNNNLHLREYIGTPSDIITVKGDGSVLLNGMSSSAKRPLFVDADGALAPGPDFHYFSGSPFENNETYYEALHLEEGARIINIEFRYLDNNDSEGVGFYLNKTSKSTASVEEVGFYSGSGFQSSLDRTKTLTVPPEFGVIDNQNYYYRLVVRLPNSIFSPNGLLFYNYFIKYQYE